MERIYTALRDVETLADYQLDKSQPYVERFCKAMDDDFNTPEALSVLFEVAKRA